MNRSLSLIGLISLALSTAFIFLAACQKSESDPSVASGTATAPRLRLLHRDSHQNLTAMSWDAKNWAPSDRVVFGSTDEIDQLQKMSLPSLREYERQNRGSSRNFESQLNCLSKTGESIQKKLSQNREWARVTDLLPDLILAQLLYSDGGKILCQVQIKITDGSGRSQNFSLKDVTIEGAFDEADLLLRAGASNTALNSAINESDFSQVFAGPLQGAGDLSLICSHLVKNQHYSNRATFRLSDFEFFERAEEEKTLRADFPLERCRLMARNEFGFTAYTDEFRLQFASSSLITVVPMDLLGASRPDLSIIPILELRVKNETEREQLFALPKETGKVLRIQAVSAALPENTLVATQAIEKSIFWTLPNGNFKEVQGSLVFPVAPHAVQTVQGVFVKKEPACLVDDKIVGYDVQWIGSNAPGLRRVSVTQANGVSPGTIETLDQYSVTPRWYPSSTPGRLQFWVPYAHAERVASAATPISRVRFDSLCYE